MLKFKINTNEIASYMRELKVSSYNIVDVEDSAQVKDKSIVYCFYDEYPDIKANEHLTVSKSVSTIYNETLKYSTVSEDVNVLSINESDSLFSFYVDRYKHLDISDIKNIKNSYEYIFTFSKPHYFSKENDIELYLKIGRSNGILEDSNLYYENAYIDSNGIKRKSRDWFMTKFILLDDFIKCRVDSSKITCAIAYYSSESLDSFISGERGVNGSVNFYKQNMQIPKEAKYIIVSSKADTLFNYRITYYDNSNPEGNYLLLNNCTYFDNYSIKVYTTDVEFKKLVSLGDLSLIPVYRKSVIIDNDSPISVFADNKLKTITIPLSSNFNTDLYTNDYINEFVDKEKTDSINNIVDMEKLAYSPYILKNDGNLNEAKKIKINLHFRQHRGENWQCSEDSYWNGVNSNWDGIDSNIGCFIDEYFSMHERSNQSDLMYYADFTNLDIKYQKNKLKKSFLRFSFYDSKDPSNQNLLAYSTVFINSGRIYSKFAKNYYNEPYRKIREKETGSSIEYIIENNLVGIRNDREPYSVLIKDLNDDEIEKLRLSTQFVIEDKYSSKNSSEGFYIYLWDNDDNIPNDLYMKIEYNSAEYGRTIPFMMPYKLESENKGKGIKTFEEIMSDWSKNNTSNTVGYSIKKYNEYSYIKLKYVYDSMKDRRIYYMDSELYGDSVINNDGNDIVLNLYEAKITN